MAITTMRELLRAPGKAFESVDQGETCLITRHGRPVAALVPVDQADAEKFILAAAPEFAESRREAEHADSEGRTSSLEEVAARFAVDLEASDENGDDEVAEKITRIMEKVRAAPPLELAAYFPRDPGEFAQLNESLVRKFASVATSVEAETRTEATDSAVEKAVEQVAGFTSDVVEIQWGREEPPTVWEAYVRGGIDAIERVQVLQGAVGEDTH